MTEKEIARWFRNLAKLKRKAEKTTRRQGKWRYKGKYNLFLRRIVRMAEQDATGWN
jgi:hypothetical protein